MRKFLILIAFLIAFIWPWSGCSQPAAPLDVLPEHESFRIDSKSVGETRTICVWTPPGYSAASESFPVWYMPDGGINEDFPHIANTLAKLIENRSIPPFILVGIENTERRRDLTGPSVVRADEEIAPLSDGASKFRSFITDEKTIFRATKEQAIVWTLAESKKE